ncbi:MAG: nucleotidyltransferase domain-containing protein [Vulcanimicrobiota bacterium]
MPDHRDWELAKEFRRRLEPLLGERLLEVRMFGSRVRGDHRPDSDLDLFVKVDTAPVKTRWAIYDVATDINAETGFAIPLAPLVMAEAEFEHLRNRERRLARDILEEGVVV